MPRIQHRRGTAAQWTSSNPVLAAGEIGVETDTGKLKIGDGAARWAARPYPYTGVEDQFYVMDEDTGDLEPMDGVSLTMGAAISWGYTLGALSVAADAETVARAAAAQAASAARVSLDGPVTVGVAPLSKAVRTATGIAATTTMTITLDTPSTSGPVTARARTYGSDGVLLSPMNELCTIPAGTTVATFPRFISPILNGFTTVEVVSAGLGATGLTTHFHN